MDIRVWHADKSGLQGFNPNGIFSIPDAMQYVEWLNKRFGNPPFKVSVDGEIVMERKDFGKGSIIYA